MTENAIHDQCMNIYRALSPDATEAYTLCRACLKAQEEYEKDVTNDANYRQFVNAGVALDAYCHEHTQIRSEVQQAYAKIQKLMRDDENDTDMQNSDSKRRIAELKAEIAALKQPGASKNKRFKTKDGKINWYGLTGPALIVSVVLVLIFEIVNKITANSIPPVTMLRGVFSLTFWGALILRGVLYATGKGGKDPDAAELEALLHMLEKEDQCRDEAKYRDAIRAEKIYDMIIKITGGASSADLL